MYDESLASRELDCSMNYALICAIKDDLEHRLTLDESLDKRASEYAAAIENLSYALGFCAQDAYISTNEEPF